MKTIESLQARVRELNDKWNHWNERANNLLGKNLDLEAKLKKENETVLFHFNKQRDLEAKLAIAIRALNFYADSENWYHSGKNELIEIDNQDGYDDNGVLTGGKTAKYALSKLNQPQNVAGKRKAREFWLDTLNMEFFKSLDDLLSRGNPGEKYIIHVRTVLEGEES